MPHVFISSTKRILSVKIFAVFRDLIFDFLPLLTLQLVHPTSKNSLHTHKLSEREIRFCFSTSWKFPRRRFQILHLRKSLFRPYIKDDVLCK